MQRQRGIICFTMALARGTKIDDYEVLGLLGAGGMGEVYRARDLVLKREVAIKILPSLVAQDPSRMKRFEQEAQAAAALNHPNILAVYRLGVFEGAPYLVSELLEGETLRQLLQHGPIPVHKITDYGIQIARGLSAAHDKGIVHRDLKPENLFVCGDGHVKILDFGLAKLTQRGFEPEATSMGETQPGMVVGTMGYMAPEQVRGSAIDSRADIFAFGTVLYEMLAGKKAFEKPTPVDSMAAILNEEPPPISQIMPMVPPGLQRVVHRCLEKKPELRFQSASDLAFALESLSGSGSMPAVSFETQSTGKSQSRSKSGRAPILIASAVVVVLLGMGAYWFAKRQTKPPFEHFSIEKAMDSDHVRTTGISPDGMFLASVMEDPNHQESLTLRQISTNTEKVVLNDPSFKEYVSVMFSPDGSYIYFRIEALGNPAPDRVDMYRISVLGGSPERILQGVDVPPTFIENGQRLCFYRDNQATNTYQFLNASAEGGDERVLASGSPAGAVEAACDPTGKRAAMEDDQGKVEALDFATGAKRPMISMAALGGYLTDFRWVPSGKGLFGISRKVPNFLGQLIFLDYPSGKLRPITNDLSSYAGLSLTANAKTIATRQTNTNSRLGVIRMADAANLTEYGPRGLRFFSWLDNGTIVASDEMSTLRTVDVGKDETTAINTAKQQWFLEPAPCGPDAIVAVGGKLDKGAMQIYKMNRDGSQAVPLTDGPYDVYPTCTPDGKWLLYGDNHNPERPEIRRVSTNGGVAQKVTSGMRFNLSDDGKFLAAIHVMGTPSLQIFSTEPVQKTQTFALPADFFFYAAFSTDDKAVYFGTKTGADSAIWRQSLDKGAAVKVSSLPGKTVRWIRPSPDGKSLGLIVETPQSEAVLLKDVQ
jgi:serine/threonine protein kinase